VTRDELEKLLDLIADLWPRWTETEERLGMLRRSFARYPFKLTEDCFRRGYDEQVATCDAKKSICDPNFGSILASVKSRHGVVR